MSDKLAWPAHSKRLSRVIESWGVPEMVALRDGFRAARALIASGTSWTTMEFARYESGVGCSATDMRAVCWCASGAVERTLMVPSVGQWRLGAEDYLVDVARYWLNVASAASANGFGIAAVNDSQREGLGHAKVLAIYDEVIDDITARIEAMRALRLISRSVGL